MTGLHSHENTEIKLAPVLENIELFADSLGHIKAKEIADIYVKSAINVQKVGKARELREKLLSVFRKRKVLDSILKEMDHDLKKMK